MLAHVPLMIVPLVLYNLGLFGLLGGGDAPWGQQLFSVSMMSGGIWSMTLGDRSSWRADQRLGLNCRGD